MKKSRRKEIERLEKLQTFMVSIKLLKKGEKIIDYDTGFGLDGLQKCLFIGVQSLR